MFPRDVLARRLNVVLACAALLVFTWLAERHAGESVFLEDQVDQLQNFESLLQFRPEGLWGAIMSGTVPPAHTLGPLGAVVFGVPVALGLGVNSIHVITSLLIAIGTAFVFVVLARIDAVFAWLWLLILSFSGVVWWNAGMLWTNTLLLPVGFHHVTFLAPFYPVVPAALVSLAMPRRLPSFATACALGVVCLALLVWKGPSVGDRVVERTPWSYSRIRAALDAVCGDGAVETDEGQGFAARLNPQYDSVLRFLMKRRLTTCRYQPGSETLIVAARDGNYRPSHEVGGVEYRLELVMPPGIARYRRLR